MKVKRMILPISILMASMIGLAGCSELEETTVESDVLEQAAASLQNADTLYYEDYIAQTDTIDTTAKSAKKSAAKTSASSGKKRNATDSSYVLPYSNSRYYSTSELSGLSKRDLRLARNEIFARHGRLFDDKQLQKYFWSKTWYNGTVSPSDFSYDVFNDYELKNIRTIQLVESGRTGRTYTSTPIRTRFRNGWGHNWRSSHQTTNNYDTTNQYNTTNNEYNTTNNEYNDTTNEYNNSTNEYNDITNEYYGTTDEYSDSGEEYYDEAEEYYDESEEYYDESEEYYDGTDEYEEDSFIEETDEWEMDPEEDMAESISFTFADVAGASFTHSSGAGAWAEGFTVQADGSFEGDFMDADMGDTGDEYPNGTEYLCEFYGIFSDPVQMSDYACSVSVASMEYAEEPGTEEILDGVRYAYSEAGIYQGDEITIYQPGMPTSDLPNDVVDWLDSKSPSPVSGDTLSAYVFVDESTGSIFV